MSREQLDARLTRDCAERAVRNASAVTLPVGRGPYIAVAKLPPPPAAVSQIPDSSRRHQNPHFWIHFPNSSRRHQNPHFWIQSSEQPYEVTSPAISFTKGKSHPAAILSVSGHAGHGRIWWSPVWRVCRSTSCMCTMVLICLMRAVLPWAWSLQYFFLDVSV